MLWRTLHQLLFICVCALKRKLYTSNSYLHKNITEKNDGSWILLYFIIYYIINVPGKKLTLNASSTCFFASHSLCFLWKQSVCECAAAAAQKHHAMRSLWTRAGYSSACTVAMETEDGGNNRRVKEIRQDLNVKCLLVSSWDHCVSGGGDWVSVSSWFIVFLVCRE